MARPGITFDQVAEAATVLTAEGVRATLDAVRERLGTGSMNTIQRHLKAWRENQPKQPPAPVELPADVARSMNAWVVQASTVARSEAETEMLRAQAEADLLSKNGAQVEAERDRLKEEVAALTTERDQAAALAKERADDLERMARDLERERQVANSAQIETAASQLRLEAHAQQLVDLKAEVGRLTGALDAERQAKGKAETQAAVLQTELAAEAKAAGIERDRARTLQEQLEQMRSHANDLRDELGQQLQEVARLAAALDAAQKAGADAASRAAGLQSQLDQAQEAGRIAREEYDSRLREAAEASRADLVAERQRADRFQTEAQAALLVNAELKTKLAAAEARMAQLEETAQKVEK